MKFNELLPGDFLKSTGDRAYAPISGKVLKVNRVTVEIESAYFNTTLRLKVRKDHLRGTVRAARNGEIHDVTL